MKDPLISVIMPVYNAGQYLVEAVESILGQELTDFEFIIINDGSTDDSSGILGNFAERDPRLLVVNRPNGGYSSALNEALERTRGRFIARMDADDISLPARFSRQVEFLQRNREHVAVGTKAIVVDREGDPVTFRDCPIDHDTIDGDHMKGFGGQIVHPSVMIRREAMEAVGGYRTEFEPAEDLDLFLRLAEIGRLANLSEFLLKYRLHDKNTSVTRVREQFLKSKRAVLEAGERRGLQPEVQSENNERGQFMVSAIDQKKYYIRAAIEAGFLRTARKHAWRIWRQHSSSVSAWNLLFRSLTGMKAETALRMSRLVRLGTRKKPPVDTCIPL